MAKVLLALLLGLGLGILMAALLPADSLLLARVVSVAEPVGTLWVTAIRMTVIPLIVPLLIVGVAGGGSAARIGSLGLRALGLCFAMLSAAAIFTAIVGPWLLHFLALDPASTASLRAGAHVTLPAAADLSFRSWLVSLVPANPVKAAADGALLPVVLFTMLYAFALARSTGAAKDVQLQLLDSISKTMLRVVHWVLALAPLGIFGLALVLGAHLGTSAAAALGYYIALTFVMHVAVAIPLYLLVATMGGVSVWRFAQAVLPAQVVAFSTRSSIAALPVLVKGARDALELPDDVSSFVVPLLVSTYKLSAAINWTLGALFIAHLYGITLEPTQLAMFAAGSVLLSTSSPGIPSGGLLIQAPLYAAVGLPVEGIGILIAVDTVPDMIKTALNVTADLGVATILGRTPALTSTSGGAAHG